MGTMKPLATSVSSQILLLFVDFCKPKIPFLVYVEGYVGPGMYPVVLDGEPRPMKDSVLLLTSKRHDNLTLVSTEHLHELYGKLITLVALTSLYLFYGLVEIWRRSSVEVQYNICLYVDKHDLS
jgi:hypothetical protein